MKNKIITIILMIVCLLIGYIIGNKTVKCKVTTEDLYNYSLNNIVKNQYIVTFKENVTSKDIDKFFSSIENTSRIKLLDNMFLVTTSKKLNTRKEVEDYCSEIKNKFDIIEYCDVNSTLNLDN